MMSLESLPNPRLLHERSARNYIMMMSLLQKTRRTRRMDHCGRDEEETGDMHFKLCSENRIMHWDVNTSRDAFDASIIHITLPYPLENAA
mmetsp:Transcript_41185/g.99224  ORF Transcript_41185/g.99224 Transcript_41185/m.99224 type:complete len:90 (+) Transcript_41185:464-733(+)